MHAVLVKVSISDFEGSVKELRETVVPRISQLPGFVAGYWTRSGDGSNGRSLVVFESEEAAKSAAERIRTAVPEGVTLESAEVREAFQRRGIVKMKADWTNGDPVNTKLLQHFGRPGVPLYVLYPGKNDEPIVFPELLTKGMVLEKLETSTRTVASQ